MRLRLPVSFPIEPPLLSPSFGHSGPRGYRTELRAARYWASLSSEGRSLATAISIPNTVEMSASTDSPTITSARRSFLSFGLGGAGGGGGVPFPPERTNRGLGVDEGSVMDVGGSCMLLKRLLRQVNA